MPGSLHLHAWSFSVKRFRHLRKTPYFSRTSRKNKAKGGLETEFRCKVGHGMPGPVKRSGQTGCKAGVPRWARNPACSFFCPGQSEFAGALTQTLGFADAPSDKNNDWSIS